MEANSFFHINVLGQIESCWFPIGFGGSKLFCRYETTAGPDWELVSGISAGVTQCSSSGNGRIEEIVFNMPIEMMYKSTNPFGWPQITFSFYGTNWWGTESSQGYARLHVPLGGGKVRMRAPIITAKCSNIWAAMMSWLTDRRPELKDPKVLTESNKTNGLLTESYGEVVVSLQSITRGADQLSLDWGQR